MKTVFYIELLCIVEKNHCTVDNACHNVVYMRHGMTGTRVRICMYNTIVCSKVLVILCISMIQNGLLYHTEKNKHLLKLLVNTQDTLH